MIRMGLCYNCLNTMLFSFFGGIEMKKNLLIPVCSWIVLVIVVILIAVNVVIPENKYRDAAALMESGDYAKAAEAFTALGDFQDSAQKAASAKLGADYQAAEALMESGDYTGAAEAFTALADYKDSAQRAEGCISADGTGLSDSAGSA